MKNLFLPIFLFLVIGCQTEKTSEVVQLVNKNILYDYGSTKYEVEFVSSDSLLWTCIEGEEKGKSALEKYALQQLQPNQYFVSWVEKDGLGVSQVLNLNNKQVSTFLKIDKEIISLQGKLRVRD